MQFWVPSFLEHSIPTILDPYAYSRVGMPLSILSLVCLLTFGPHRYFRSVNIY